MENKICNFFNFTDQIIFEYVSKKIKSTFSTECFVLAPKNVLNSESLQFSSVTPLAVCMSTNNERSFE